jgi:phosphoglycerate dehydrogenase-like enzyme
MCDHGARVPILGLHAATGQPFWRVPDELILALERRLPQGWELARADDAAALPGLVRRASAILGWPFPAALARRAERLRWVHFFTAAVPEGWRASPVEVTSAAGVNADSVAEHGLFLALAALRGLRADSLARGWDPAAFELARAPGAMVATVLGHGHVGRRLARLLVPLFGAVRAVARTAGEADPGVELFPAGRLGEALAGAALVVLALPLTAETRALLAPDRLFPVLHPEACLINLARGELLDEAALLAFLAAHPRSRYLADVAHPEPYPDGLPLRGSPRVVLTPHVAGRREDAWARIGAQALALVGERLERLS